MLKRLFFNIEMKWKIDEKCIKNQSKMDQKWTKHRSKLRSGGLQGRFGGLLGRLGRSKGSLKASWTVLEASWKRLGREKWPTWLQLGPKLGPKLELKWIKNPSKNRSKNWWLLGSVFGRILVDFGRENEGKLAPKWDQKSMLTSKGRFCKNTYKTNRILMIFEVRGVETSIKNRSKNEAKKGGILASIFGRFWEPGWERKSTPSRAKIDPKKH